MPGIPFNIPEPLIPSQRCTLIQKTPTTAQGLYSSCSLPLREGEGEGESFSLTTVSEKAVSHHTHLQPRFCGTHPPSYAPFLPVCSVCNRCQDTPRTESNLGQQLCAFMCVHMRGSACGGQKGWMCGDGGDWEPHSVDTGNHTQASELLSYFSTPWLHFACNPQLSWNLHWYSTQEWHLLGSSAVNQFSLPCPRRHSMAT